MFDPVFALAFLLGSYAVIAAITFLTVRKFLSVRATKILTWIVPVAALIGFFGAINAADRALGVLWLETPPVARVGTGFAGAIIFVLIAGWIGQKKFGR